VVVRHEVEHVLFQVGARAGDAVHLALPDHLGEGEAQLRGAHRAGQGHEHPPTIVEERAPALGGVDERGGVEMAVVLFDEPREWACSASAVPL